MHLYILTRGIKHERDRLIKELECIKLSWKDFDKQGVLQLSVRPIELWELVFPHDQLPVIQNTLWGDQGFKKNVWDELERKQKFTLYALQKILKAKKLPDLDLTQPKYIIYNKNVAIYPIGIRDDQIRPEGFEFI